MIVVIADDLSGAAELAGIAARFGYRTEVHTVFDPHTDAEVVALDTDTRWRPAAEAARIVAGVTASIVSSRPEWIFKKTDSVLRGNVRAEIESILAFTNQKRALLVPANPSKARIIRGGAYFMDGIPLDQSAFGRDPEHPRWTSNVSNLLGPAGSQDRLIVPDAVSVDDVSTCVAEVDTNTLPAGGADFFEAVLKSKSRKNVRARSEALPFALTGPTLFVCGSAAAWDNRRAEACIAHGIPVISMPQQIFDGDVTAAAMQEWCAATSAALRNHGRAMLAIGRCSIERSMIPPKQLIDLLVKAAISILATNKIEWLALEGGTTAAAVVQQFGWTRMTALPAELTGVAAMAVTGGPTMLIKSGSYPWPRAVFVDERSG